MMETILTRLLDQHVAGVAPVPNVVAATGPVFACLEQAVTWMTNHLQDAGAEPTEENITAAAANWAVENGLNADEEAGANEIGEGIGGGQFRVNGLKIQNFRSVGSAFDPIVGIGHNHVVIFRGANGTGKTTIRDALMRPPGNVGAAQGFLGGGNQRYVTVGLCEAVQGAWIPIGEDRTPRFRDLGNASVLVGIRLSDFFTNNLDVNDCLPMAAGVATLNNKLQVAQKLGQVGGAGGGRLVLLRPNVAAPATPTEVTHAFEQWSVALNFYRQLCGTQVTGPVRTDLDWWNHNMAELFAELNLEGWQDLAPETWGERDARFTAIQTAIFNHAAPAILIETQNWLNGFINATNLALPPYTPALDALTHAVNTLLGSVQAAHPVAGLEAGATPQEVTEALCAAARLNEPVPETPNQMAETAIKALRLLREQIEEEIRVISGELQAIDLRREIMSQSLQYLIAQEDVDSCPVCSQAIVRARLIADLTTILGVPDPKTAPLEEERRQLEDQIQSIQNVTTDINNCLAAWEQAHQAFQNARTQLLQALNRLAQFPQGAEALGIAAIGQMAAAAQGLVEIQNAPAEALPDFARGNLNTAQAALAAVNALIDTSYRRGQQFTERLNTWRSLATVINHDTATCAPAWVNQANAARLDALETAIVNQWIVAANACAATLDQEIQNLTTTILESQDVLQQYSHYRKAGDHAFFPSLAGQGDHADKLSEGYRMLHALAAVMAVAAAQTPGNDADFVIIDEPTRGLDPNLRQAVANLLGAYCPKQLIVTTYDDEFANQLREAAVGQGKAVADYTLSWTNDIGTTWTVTPQRANN